MAARHCLCHVKLMFGGELQEEGRVDWWDREHVRLFTVVFACLVFSNTSILSIIRIYINLVR